jgi:hypothetical protein
MDNDAENVPLPPDVPAAAPVPMAAPPQLAGYTAELLGLTIIVPDLRNGDPANITQAAPKASIAQQFKWTHVTGMTSDNIVRFVDIVIRATYAQYLAAATVNITDAQRAMARDAAIIMGSVRAGAAAAYKLTPADLNAEEIVGAGFEIHVVNDRATTRVDAGTAGGKHAVATGMAGLTRDEVAVVGTLIYLGMAVPAMQGISLVLSGHHFLPTTKNTFAGMKKQASQVGGSVVAAWIEQRGDTFDDLAFHKACHPISAPRKRTWAKSTDLAARLIASGHGAVAIRLPALPSDAQGGKAALAVIGKAAPVIEGMGHTVSVDQGAALIAAVEVAPEGRDEINAVNAVKAWLAANASSIAFCAGIVQAIAESGAGGRETTLNAYSMRKIVSEKAADVSRGTTYARAYTTRLREQALSGEFPDPQLRL